MWLYYPFTASVLLFLYSVSDPLNPDAVLDLALLDELKALCGSLGAGSDGARRVRQIVDGMERVAWEVVKRAARRRKREAQEEAGEPESSSSKRHRSGDGGEDVATGAQEGAEVQEPAIEEAEEVTGTEALSLENVPQNFEWEQWDQWLEDAPFDLE